MRELEAEVEAHVGRPVAFDPVSGGDIHDAYRVRLTDDRVIFVKTSADAPPTMFPSEARGLAWLAEAGALAVPTVLAATPEMLALEWLDPARGVRFEERLGRGLAALHRASPGAFGLEENNFIGRLPQRNDGAFPRWCDFYRERRLRPMVERAASLLGTSLLRRFDALYEALPALVGPEEPPARLHGDLWGGNLHAQGGAPCLIDPAVYGGHREMDLAMMQLFGGFGPRVFAAYDEAWPRAEGHEARVPLYQLYPLLVHVNLFGSGYVGSVKRALDALARMGLQP